jgi:hypothetical protein
MPRFSRAAAGAGVLSGLVVDGADGGVWFPMEGLEAGDDGVERRLGGHGKLLGEFGESEGCPV